MARAVTVVGAVLLLPAIALGQKSEDFANKHGLYLHIENVKNNEGASITEASNLTLRGRKKPCSVCGLTKRYYMNRVGLQGGYDVVVTGHNLDDEAAVLFGNSINWQVGYLARQHPVLEASSKGFIQRAKPFFQKLPISQEQRRALEISAII